MDVGFSNKVLRLDNEVLRDLIKAIKEQKLKYQIASSEDHRTSQAEWTIRDFKTYFISDRSYADRLCPINAWDLLPHIVHTLNLLQISK